MMKWLRKHTKRIMVVVVLFSMFAFVGGAALQQILAPRGGADAFFTLYGEEVSRKDYAAARRDAAVLEAIRVPWQYDQQYGRSDGTMRIEHWYMLCHEAEQAGIEVSDEEVESAIARQRQWLTGAGFPAGYMESLREGRGRYTLVDIRQAMRRHLGILKNATRVFKGGMPSEQEVRHYVSDTETKVKVRFVALDAQRFVDEEEPAPVEALEDRFEKYKDVDAATSETGEGYRHPRRVRLQYIVAQTSKIERHVQVTFDEAKKHWKKNKGKYTKMEYVEEAVPTTGPTSTQPVAPKKVSKRVELPFSEARERVEMDIRKARAMQLAERAMRELTTEMGRPWEDVKVDQKTGYKPISVEARDPDFMRSAQDRVARDLGVSLQYAETGLLGREAIGNVRVLANVTMEGEEGGEPMRVSEYAFHVPAFVEQAFGQDIGSCLQLYQAPDVPLRWTGWDMADGRIMQSTTLALFRVVEARESEPPANLDEIRSEVEADYRLSRAYDGLGALAQEFTAVSAMIGIEPALELFDEVRTKGRVAKAMTPPAFARRVSMRTQGMPFLDALRQGRPTLAPPTVPTVGESATFVDGCFDMASDGWEPPALTAVETERMRTATTRPAAMPTPTVQLLPIPKMKKWFVIELLEIEEVDTERFESELRTAAYGNLQMEQGFKLRLSWFNAKNIQARCGYELIRTETAESAEEGMVSDEEAEA